MPSAGDYQFFQRHYTSKNIDRTILAAHTSTDHANVINPKTASHQIWIQKVVVAITTHADQDIAFQDGAGTPVLIARWFDEATAGTARPNDLPTIVFDFGPQGTPLTIGEELDIILSAAGIAARVHIEPYEKLGAAIAYDSGAANQ